MVRVHAFKLAALALACAVLILGSQHTLAAVIKGSAMYRERIALPPTAVFEVTLEDSSRADRPADVLGRARLEPAGQPPFRFEISYDPAQIAPGGRYVLRAQITDRGKLLFVTDRPQPVALNAAETDVTLTLRSAPRPPPSALGPLPASFAGELPCADCPGVKWHLDLLVDGTYLLRMAYHDRRPEAGWDEIGRWTVSGQPAVLRLSGTGDDTQAFEVRGPNRLRKLDIEGAPDRLPAQLRTDAAAGVRALRGKPAPRRYVHRSRIRTVSLPCALRAAGCRSRPKRTMPPWTQPTGRCRRGRPFSRTWRDASFTGRPRREARRSRRWSSITSSVCSQNGRANRGSHRWASRAFTGSRPNSMALRFPMRPAASKPTFFSTPTSALPGPGAATACWGVTESRAQN